MLGKMLRILKIMPVVKLLVKLLLLRVEFTIKCATFYSHHSRDRAHKNIKVGKVHYERR